MTNPKVGLVLKLSGWMLIGLSLLVSLPLTLKTIREGGGPWGFEIIGLAVLLPLNGYLIFGVAAIANRTETQRLLFLVGHIFTLICGIAGHLIFPVYPNWITLAPVLLALAGIVSRNNFRLFLVGMIVLASAANVMLLVWEIEFGRTLPLLQWLQDSAEAAP